MTIEPDDSITAFKALAIFSTLRSNLALADAFLRNSIIEVAGYGGEDLGFLSVVPGKDQLSIHNRSVTMIVVALLFDCLENYCHLVRIRPRLEDPLLQKFFDGLVSRRRFIRGMKRVRDGVFHVRSRRTWRGRDVRHFDSVCAVRGGTLTVMAELHGLFYGFTERIFQGELQIWPDSVCEEIDRWEQERPNLVKRFRTGEINIVEFIEARLEEEHD